MPHPFFDVTAYPWHRPEAVELHKALYQAISAPPAIDLQYKKCADNLTPLPLTANAADIWKAALENLTTAGVLRKLCQSLLADTSVKPIHGKVLDVSQAEDITEQSFLADDFSSFMMSCAWSSSRSAGRSHDHPATRIGVEGL